MFVTITIPAGNGGLQFRTESLTGFRCRISPGRLKRDLDLTIPAPSPAPSSSAGCPFCPDAIQDTTPAFPDGNRIIRGESVTFPNKFPFGEWHTVTVITRAHTVAQFTQDQITDALLGQVESLQGHEGCPSINWNYLPSAGATIAHPHLQGLIDRQPSVLAEHFIRGSTRYLRKTGRCYWEDLIDHEHGAGRFLFGEEVRWIASAVPLGEREVRGILPVTGIDEIETYIPDLARGLLRVIRFYRHQHTHAFNFSLFLGQKRSRGFRAFCSIVARINPNSRSLCDTAFMEKLHLEPVILTLPEDLAAQFVQSG